MAWNKTPEDKVKSIQKDLEDLDFSYTDIAKKHEVSYWLVGQICRDLPDLRKKRYSHICSKSKMGDKNPMKGKTGLKHHSSKDGYTYIMGYKAVFPPDWWEGKTPKGRVYEHILICCEKNKLTALPKGFCVHHKDHNKLNNDPDNLELLTISEHMKHHMTEYWKVQRLSREGVENSVLEAQDNLRVDDIV